jgi:hypothetical protein
MFHRRDDKAMTARPDWCRIGCIAVKLAARLLQKRIHSVYRIHAHCVGFPLPAQPRL